MSLKTDTSCLPSENPWKNCAAKLSGIETKKSLMSGTIRNIMRPSDTMIIYISNCLRKFTKLMCKLENSSHIFKNTVWSHDAWWKHWLSAEYLPQQWVSRHRFEGKFQSVLWTSPWEPFALLHLNTVKQSDRLIQQKVPFPPGPRPWPGHMLPGLFWWSETKFQKNTFKDCFFGGGGESKSWFYNCVSWGKSENKV